MATFKWFNGNQGFYSLDGFGNYIEASRTATSLVMVFDPLHGAVNPTAEAAQITLTFRGYVAVPVETGPDTGKDQVIGGFLTGVRYTAGDGSVLLDVTRLAVSLPVVLAALQRGDGAAVWQMLTQGPHNFLGSDDASGPAQTVDGDVMETGAGDDGVSAFGGDDYIQDRGGADRYNGGSGYDTVSYDGWYYRPWAVTRGISVDLVLGTVVGPDGATDSLVGIEAISGTFLADVMKGNAGANSFAGFAGADRFDGRGGFDMVSYGREASQGGLDGIKANLLRGQVRDGFGYTDVLVSIEGVQGTGLNDVFFDNAGDNFFAGGGGDDLLQFGAGNDTGRGGAGADSFVFRTTAFGDDTVEDFSAAQGDVIQIASVTAFGQLAISAVLVNGVASAFVECSAGSITMVGVLASALTAADFGF